MCMEDIRLGRSTGAVETRVAALFAGNVALVPQSAKRIALIVSTDGANSCMISTNNASLGVNTGLFVSPNAQPMILHIEDYGSLLRQAWFVRGTGANLTVTVVDVELEQQ